jgi:leader peptidase (prepilin peptidase)/N-methyltransferase
VIFPKGREDLEGFSIKSFIFDKKVIFAQALLILSAMTLFDYGIRLLFIALLIYILVLLSFIDYKYKAVPDYLLLSVIFVAPFVSENMLHFFQNGFMFAGGFVILNFIVTFYIQNIKSRMMKNESLKNQIALGEGDIPIITMIGGILGIKYALLAIIIASCIALVHSVYNKIKKEEETPFIPYLVIGFLVVFFMLDYIKLEWILE